MLGAVTTKTVESQISGQKDISALRHGRPGRPAKHDMHVSEDKPKLPDFQTSRLRPFLKVGAEDYQSINRVGTCRYARKHR